MFFCGQRATSVLASCKVRLSDPQPCGRIEVKRIHHTRTQRIQRFRSTLNGGMMEAWNTGSIYTALMIHAPALATAARIWFPPTADSKKQGKLGLNGRFPREAQYSCMRKRGKRAGKPRSPPPFLNQIRDAWLTANNPARSATPCCSAARVTHAPGTPVLDTQAARDRMLSLHFRSGDSRKSKAREWA